MSRIQYLVGVAEGGLVECPRIDVTGPYLQVEVSAGSDSKVRALKAYKEKMKIEYWDPTIVAVRESSNSSWVLVSRDVTLRQFDSIVSKEYDILVVD